MLRPSTRATWKPNVTISVAYTAAENSALMPPRTSWLRGVQRLRSCNAAFECGTTSQTTAVTDVVSTASVSATVENDVTGSTVEASAGSLKTSVGSGTGNRSSIECVQDTTKARGRGSLLPRSIGTTGPTL